MNPDATHLSTNAQDLGVFTDWPDKKSILLLPDQIQLRYGSHNAKESPGGTRSMV